MSGIFKGDSIYKSGGGGGGGGYSDGGELVDADFIKVENNTISSYENEDRNQVNFYFENGELLNSVIEFTTLVNSAVNVYYINEYGLYFKLNLVGTNTVNANTSYTINITGNSYTVNEVDEESSEGEYEYDGKLYGTITYDNVDGKKYIWTKNIKKADDSAFWSMAEARAVSFPNGFSLPSYNDCVKFMQYVQNKYPNYPYSLRDPDDPRWTYRATGESHFNFPADGCYCAGVYYPDEPAWGQGFWLASGSSKNLCYIYNGNNDISYGLSGPDFKYNIRLLKIV